MNKSDINFYLRLEDGTVSFLSILSLRHGFDVLERLVPPTRNHQTMQRISEYTFGLARYAYQKLSRLCHLNFKPAVKFYNDTDYEDVGKQGGVVNFNLLGSDGSYIGFAEVRRFLRPILVRQILAIITNNLFQGRTYGKFV